MTVGGGRRPYLTTRDLVLVAVVSAAGGTLSSYIGYLGNLVNRVLGVPFGAGQFMAGLHVFWFLIVIGLTGKPGAATLAGVLKGVGEMLMGSTHGAVIVIVSGVQGALADAIWLGLRRLMPPLPVFMAAGSVSAMSNVLAFQILFVSGATLGYIALMCSFAAASGTVLGGYLAFSILESLRGSRLMRPEAAALLGPPGARKTRVAAALIVVAALAVGGVYYYTTIFESPWGHKLGVEVQGQVERPVRVALDLEDPRVITVNTELRGKVTYVAPQDYTGLPVAAALQQAGVKPGATRLRAIASDGYEVEFELARVLSEGTMLISEDGDTLRLVAPGYEGGYWVRKLSRLVID